VLAGLLANGGVPVDKEEVLRVAEETGSFDGYPASIIFQMFDVRDITKPTASQLASQVWRRMVLERAVRYYAWGSSLVPLVRGTFVHDGLEHVSFPPTSQVITELRLGYNVPGTDIRLSGQADVYYPKYARLEDYKTCQKVPDFIRDTHAFQLIVYSWLLRWHGYPVDQAYIDYISWSNMRQVTITSDYQPVSHNPLFQDQDKFIEEVSYRYEVLRAGFEDGIVPSMEFCNTSWCYNCPVKWACDQIPPEGGTIRVGEMDQRDYT